MKDLTTLTVSLGERSYPIYVGRGILEEIDSYADLSRRVLIVTDDGVPACYAQSVAKKAKAPVLVTVKTGEGSKSFSVLEELCRTMLQKGFSRGDCVVAVGGGVVGDLAGFAAASYMRGIDFYNVPTTLLSQVDSSIGGKVAINLDHIKNVIGAFYQPRAVLIDPDVLKTLPARQINAGLAEALKMATTFDEALFEAFEKKDVLQDIEEIIIASLRIKKDVVEKDEKESSLRRVLNFGHTIGHGIESILGSEERENGLYHGECVALGMIPMCAKSVRDRLVPVLKKLSLPTECALSAEEIAVAMKHDKKADGASISAVFAESIGSYTQKKVSVDELTTLIKDVFG